MKIYLKTKNVNTSDFQEFNDEEALYKYIYFNWCFFKDFEITIIDEKEFDVVDIFDSKKQLNLF